MARTLGAVNYVWMDERTSITTTRKQDIKHLSEHTGTPLEDFLSLLKHQEQFLNWVTTRHKTIVDLKKIINAAKPAGSGGPLFTKESTYAKYRWYIEQLVLLEAINAFEAFYKRTIVDLGVIIKGYVNPDSLKDYKVDGSIIWLLEGKVSVPSLLFESGLYHDLGAIDKTTLALIGNKRYDAGTKLTPKFKKRIQCLKAIFQIRHTLSHNNGRVTAGDRAKFKRLGFTIDKDQVIDPSKDELRYVAVEELKAEAKEFTTWIAEKTAAFLIKCEAERGLVVEKAKREPLETLLGKGMFWEAVPWK